MGLHRVGHDLVTEQQQQNIQGGEEFIGKLKQPGYETYLVKGPQ